MFFTKRGEIYRMNQKLARVRQLFSTDLVKVSFLNGISTVIRMFAGLISTKVVAAVIGPVGIALLGQLNNFSTIVLSIANGGITTGITKYVSEHSVEHEKAGKYIGTAFRLTLIFSVITGLILILGARYFSGIILKTAEYTVVFYIFGITLIFYALNTLFLAILNGFKEYAQFVRINIISSITSLLFSVVMAVKFGVLGALISAVTFQSVVFFITVWLTRKSHWFNWALFTGGVDRKVLVSLGHYSFMALATAIIVPLSQLFVRGFIVKQLSVSDAGIWEGMNRISGMYLLVIITSFSVYYLPRLAELRNDKAIRKEVMSVYQVMIPFLILASGMIYMFRDLIISILFTRQFTEMRTLFAFQLTGDIIKMSGWVLGYLMVAKAMSRTYIFMEMLNYSIFALLSFVLVKYYGIRGATIAYAIGHFVYLVGMIIIFRKLLFRPRLS